MRVIRVVAAAGAVAFMLASAGPALAADGGGSPYDFASGGGQTEGGDQFGFSALDGPNGSSGHVTYRTATFEIGGAVRCINAGGGRLATIGIIIEQSSDPALVGGGFLLYVEDGDAVDAARPDRVSYEFVAASVMRRCPRRHATQTLASGNVVVEDSADEDPVEEPSAFAESPV